MGAGPAAAAPDGARVVDGTGCLATPGLVNTHHHLYQWLTQGRAQQARPFSLADRAVPGVGADRAGPGARRGHRGLAWLALTGCTTSTDHHYVFPRRRRGGQAFAEPLEAEIAAAAAVGLRFHPVRGSMDLGQSAGGLPPDEVVEDTDAGPGRHRGGDRGP